MMFEPTAKIVRLIDGSLCSGCQNGTKTLKSKAPSARSAISKIFYDDINQPAPAEMIVEGLPSAWSEKSPRVVRLFDEVTGRVPHRLK